MNERRVVETDRQDLMIMMKEDVVAVAKDVVVAPRDEAVVRRDVRVVSVDVQAVVEFQDDHPIQTIPNKKSNLSRWWKRRRN
jgi:hypothetical protein